MNQTNTNKHMSQQTIDMAWVLWEKIADLETLLWEIYYEPFIDKCIESEEDAF